MFIRALLAFLALPGVVAFAIPLLLVRVPMRDEPFHWLALIPLAIGIGLLLSCVREFYVAGTGTLAPWDPPRRLVTTGPYRFSRNPMYLAVPLILAGWALGFSSRTLWLYTLLVIAAFHARVVFFEEPYLARTFRDDWKRYASRVPRWIFPGRRAVAAAWVALLVALPMGGLIYEAVADGLAQREFTAPGTLVDIGGRRLHLLCIGKGEPVVIFIHSGWGSSLSGERARGTIATRTTVCSYDRPGHGWSDPGPDVASAGSLVRDLGVLQDRAKLPSPLIVVASSIGGLTAELFARQYPERVAGLVFLDAANSFALPLRAQFQTWLQPAACSAGFAARFGVIRLLDPFVIATGDDDGRRGAAITYNPRPWDHLCAMARGLAETVREFEEAPQLRGDIPLTVLSAATPEGLAPPGVRRFIDVEQLRTAVVNSHQQLAKLSSRGQWAIVPGSGHLIASTNPDAVADAVLAMLDELE